MSIWHPRWSLASGGRLAAAHAIARAEEYAFDYLLYPYALFGGGPAFARATGLSPTAGYWLGFATMCAASAALNVLYLCLYDRSATDWFGFEAARRWAGRLPAVLEHATRPLLFAYLSVWHSPLFATLWARSQAAPFQMKRTDWAVFATSIMLANVGWAGCLSIAAWALRWMVALWPA